MAFRGKDKVVEYLNRIQGYVGENAKAVEIGDSIKELYGEKKSTKQKTPTRTIRSRDKKTKTTT